MEEESCSNIFHKWPMFTGIPGFLPDWSVISEEVGPPNVALEIQETLNREAAKSKRNCTCCAEPRSNAAISVNYAIILSLTYHYD
jgi:hypothetical protein